MITIGNYICYVTFYFTKLFFVVTSSFVSIGTTKLTWKVVLSQDMCTIFDRTEDQDMRMESPPFNMDLNWEGKTTQLMFSLVMGVASLPDVFDGFVVSKLSHTCCDCNCWLRTYSGPTLSIRNLGDENVDLAKIVVKRNVFGQVDEQMREILSDSIEHKIALKRHGQKLVESYKDLSNCLSFNKYTGDKVIFEFNLNIEVFKLTAN